GRDFGGFSASSSRVSPETSELCCSGASTREAVSRIAWSNRTNTASLVEAPEQQSSLVSGETLEELAENIGVPAETLVETVTKYNSYVEAGEDPDFGRTKMPAKIEVGPFWAVKVTPAIHHTMAGIAINSKAQVLNADGNAIPGLYAAGEVTGGVHGANRLGGNALCDIIVFGRIAGKEAASFAAGK
ncbi:MAG TPA: FAD-binding protein, partial [Firmicutes bacterium]|nr:FAD-binding protein [Bacillota bacterium]